MTKSEDVDVTTTDAESKCDITPKDADAAGNNNTTPQSDLADTTNKVSKARHRWEMIRQFVRHSVFLGTRELVVSHGIHAARRLCCLETVCQAIYNKNSQEYITIDGRLIKRFSSSGSPGPVRKVGRNPRPMQGFGGEAGTGEEPSEEADLARKKISGFTRLVFASHMNLFIGWTPGETQLVLNTCELNVSSVADAHGPVLSAVYNEQTGEVVTVGREHLTCWVFRYGGRHILARRTVQIALEGDTGHARLVLEQTSSKTQKAYVTSGTSVTVFCLHEGRMLEVRRELHVRTITALLFFNPLKYLVTAAKDGSIKVWDGSWRLQLVFVGHEAGVTALATFPHGPMLLSASLDSTLRVWSLETCDQVDMVRTEDAVLDLLTTLNRDEFVSVSGGHVDMYRIQHVHTLHTRVGYKVTDMKTTDHPQFPLRCALLCDDSSVRVINPVSGDVITTLLMNRYRGLVDAAYAVEMDILFAVYSNGDIVKCRTDVNPCEVVEEWKCPEPQKACSCLLVYEYVISEDLNSDSVTSMKRALVTKQLGFSLAGTSANRNLLLCGRKDGHLCVINMRSGEVDYEIEAHGSSGVLTMTSNQTNDQILSSGFDNTIRTWRVYPYAVEALAPLLSFYCAHPPVRMCILRDQLAVAFQQDSSATYSLVTYDLNDHKRHDHSPADDHTDAITGLASCGAMRLLATASRDGTVRVWDEKNALVRVIKLNAHAQSLAFGSEKGDLLVGIGNHVHIIDHKHYMPPSYMYKMLSRAFTPPVLESALPFDEARLEALPREDVTRLRAAQPSVSNPVHGWSQESSNLDKYTQFVDVLTDAEMQEKIREEKAREHVFSRMEQRDKELATLRSRQATVTPKRPAGKSHQTRNEAFRRYMKLFYDRPTIQMPQEDVYPEDTLENILVGPSQKRESAYRPETEPMGFFRAASSANQKLSRDAGAKVGSDGRVGEIKVKPDCYVPNSVLARLLWPQDKEGAAERRGGAAGYRPPRLSEKQLEEIKARNKQTSRLQQEESDTWDRVVVMDWSTDQEQESKEFKAKETPAAVERRVQDILSKIPTPPRKSPVESLPGDSGEEMTSEQTRLQERGSQGRASHTRRVQQVFKATASDWEVRVPSPPGVGSPGGGSSPQSDPDPSAALGSRLPDYISQFIGQPWFDSVFPNAGPETYPEPWSVSALATTLIGMMQQEADYESRAEIARALASLHQEHTLSNAASLQKQILSMLAPENVTGVVPPSSDDPAQKRFLLSCLELLQVLGVRDREFYSECMTQYVEGDADVRNRVVEILEACGLRDQESHFTEKLNGWETWEETDPGKRHRQLKQTSSQTLDKWMKSFRGHVQDTIEKLHSGHSIRGIASRSSRQGLRNKSSSSLQKSTSSPRSREQTPRRSHYDTTQSGEDNLLNSSGKSLPSRSPSKSILKRPSLQVAVSESELRVETEETSVLEPKSEHELQAERTLTVTFNRVPDASRVQRVTYIEAINYFCELQEQTAVVERVREEQTGDRTEENTVLVLPKIPGKDRLVRLGDTHTSKCKAHRETVFDTDFRLPPLTARGHASSSSRPGVPDPFPLCVRLPLHTILLSPFPEDPDPADALELLAQQPVLLTLRTAPRYYVPRRSHTTST